MPKYSVIIPVYNVESYLNACVDSVLAQDTSDHYEIILIDDGSPDGSGAICDQYAEMYPCVRVFHSENHGVSHARNKGLEMAQGEFVLFLDADDLWEPGLLREVARVTDANTDVVIFGYGRFFEDGKSVPHQPGVIPAGESGEAYLRRLFEKDLTPETSSCCYVYRSAFLKEHQLRFRKDLKVSEDFDFIMHTIGAAGRLAGTEKILYGYRARSGSATAVLSQKKVMDNLTTKAYWFRRYPTPAMADIYAENAVLAAELPMSEMSDAGEFLKQNRDIWNHVSAAPYKLAGVLVHLFGDRNGARVYYAVRSIGRKLRRRS